MTKRSIIVIATLGMMATGEGYLYPQAGQPHASQPSSPSPGQLNEAVNQYCIVCHNEQLKTGGLALDNVDAASVGANPEVKKSRAQVAHTRDAAPRVA